MSKRAVFEEVGEERQTAPPATRPARREARGAIAAWLWSLAGLVALMVLVGGLTRLTDSGLSITVWDPVMGAIPPLSDADWQAAFDAYRQTTEFQQQNHWMTLADFKPIYWWEWGHRFLGRLIGVVWLIGLVAFLATRTVPRGWTGRLVLPGLLGALQGAIGWWMVVSGLDRLDVASYRLALHLGLAFVIFMLLVWYAMKIRLEPVALMTARRARPRGVVAFSSGLVVALFAQILVGALVAGIDAGRSYVDWPLMQGQVFPAEGFALSPAWRNFFEDAATVQFVHRMLGYAVLLLALGFALAAARPGLAVLRARGRWVLGGVALQVVAGIVTVMHAAPLPLAILHQGLALAVVWLMMRARFATLYPPAQRLTA